ncbi:MAG: hypothetical protein H0X18_16810, partial [Geodermatophilaceae bacterium]|nr:hypothetical protein [Geodermatophilaceae bacterium]
MLDLWQRADDELLAPRLLFEETLNALLTGVRRGRWSTVVADGYDNWPVYFVT